MGSGKTTLFERIKEKCPEIECLDLDQVLAQEMAEAGETLGEAIERVGWDEFRDLEENKLYQILTTNSDLLVSLGVGSLSQKIIDEIDLDPEVLLVWLDTDFETCWERIRHDAGRPLVAKGKEFLKTKDNLHGALGKYMARTWKRFELP